MLLLDGRSAAYQWDSNLYLIIPGGKVGDDIHFGRNKTAAVVKAELKDGRIVAAVPNIGLQTDGEIDVYRYIYDSKGNRTIWADKLTVLPRERPDDYVYSETPVKTWNELDSRIKSLERTVPDWNQNDPTALDYVKNRFGCYKVPEGLVLEFAGNTNGLPNRTDLFDDLQFYKISDLTPHIEQFIEAKVTGTINGTKVDFNVSEDDINYIDNIVYVGPLTIYIDSQSGIWVNCEFDEQISIVINQTYVGYVKIRSSLLCNQIPRTKLASRGRYQITKSDIEQNWGTVQQKLNSPIYTFIDIYDDSKQLLASVQINEDSELSVSYDEKRNTYYTLYGVNQICYWKQGDTTITVDDRYFNLRESHKGLYLKSSAEGSSKKFKITVDDSGTLTATKVTTS